MKSQVRPNWFNLILAASLIVTLIGMVPHLYQKHAAKNARTIALSNAKNIAGGLMSFRSERGAYPCDATRVLLEDNGVDFLPDGKSSNAYLAQLIATKAIDGEKAFHTPGMRVFHEGDNVTGIASKLLSAGENGFTYIMAANGASLHDIRSSTPLVFAGVKHPGIVPIFDRQVYDGKYVAGLVDGAGIVGDLNEHGNALTKGRVHTFQTGNDSLFGKDIPTPTFPLRGTEL